MSDVKVAKFAKESGHWYDQHANLIESVPYANGKPGKKPTLRDARILDLCPGVTSIIREKAAPGLVKWQIRQHVLAALTLERQPGETDDAYLARLEVDAGEHAKQAAEEGTRIHAAIEAYWDARHYPAEYEPHVKGTARLIESLIPDAPWLPEKAVAHRYGYATKLDLHCQGYHDGAGKWHAGWLIDWKGCDGDQAELDRKTTWENHAMQLAAGRAALGAPNMRCAIGYVSRTHPGACSLIEVSEANLAAGWDTFLGCLWTWQASRKYAPSWADTNWRETA